MSDESTQENYAGVWYTGLGFGKKSALIVIDLLQGYTTEGSALYAPGVIDCVAQMPDILALARSKEVPVIHKRGLYKQPDYPEGGIWIKEAPVHKDHDLGNTYEAVYEGVEPDTCALVSVKKYARASI